MKTELISRLLLGLFIMFVLVKFVGPFLFQILWDNIFNKKKKKSVDLDVLINRKKQLMQKGNPEKKIVPRNKHKNNTQRTLARYKAFLEQLSGSSPKDEKKINDVRDIIRLFDNLQWGDGPEFYSLGKKIKEGFSIDIPQTEICDAFKEIIQNDFLLSGKSDNLPTLKEILNVIEMRVLLNTLVDELFSKGGATVMFHGPTPTLDGTRPSQRHPRVILSTG